MPSLHTFVAAMIAASVVFTSGLSVQPSPGDWTTPEPLGLIDRDSLLPFPEIATDPYDHIHVVAARNPSSGTGTATIYYTQWNGQQWSSPTDILAAPAGETIQTQGILSDSNGYLYLLWIGVDLNLSRAWAGLAEEARHWQTNTVLGEVTAASFTLLDDIEMSVASISNYRDIVFMLSLDLGETWARETIVWSPESQNQAARDVQLRVDRQGTYHLTWTETNAKLDWNPSAIWYVRSSDKGQTWSHSMRIPDQGSYVSIGFDAEDNMHLLWNHNVGSTQGRFHARSSDYGQSWTQPEWVFPGLSGRTGFPRTLLDSNRTLHQVTSGHGNGCDDCIYYSQWNDNQWSDPIRISKGIERSEAPAIALTNGNTIFAVWRAWDINDIVYSKYNTGSPAVEPLEAIEPIQSATIEPYSATGGSSFDESTTTQVTQSEEQPEQKRTPQSPSPPWTPLVLAALPSLALVILLVVIHRSRTRR